MKTIKPIFKLSVIAILILAGISDSSAQERKESFEKSYKLSKTGEFSFSCYDTDLKINTWDKNEVKLRGEIIIDGGKEEDQNKLIDIFKNPKSSESSNSLEIETNLTKSTIIIGPFIKTTLVDGQTIRVKKYKAKYEIWMPKSAALNLKSKYNKIDIANLTSNVDFKLYEANLTLASFKEGKFDMKYSSGDIGNGESAQFDVYECKFEIKNIEKVIANSKYSGFIIENTNLLAVDSYEDKFRLNTLTQGLTGKAKYSNFTINSNTQIIDLDVYESDIEAKNIQELKYNSKYSTVSAEDINTINCNVLYETKIYASNVGSLRCEQSKYDKFKFNSIGKSIYFDTAYETDIDILKALPTLEDFSGNFKYGYVNMPLDPKLEFSLNFETNYGKINFPKGRVKVDHMSDKDGSKYSFRGSTIDIPKCKIRFKSYETDFNLE